MNPSYNETKLQGFLSQLESMQAEAVKLPKGTMAKRLADAECRAIERKVIALKDKIEVQKSKVDLESLLDSIARLPLLRTTLAQREQAYQNMAESIRELRDDIATLETERARLIADDKK